MRKAMFLFLLYPVLCQAEVFKCMNDGHVTYSEKPCVSGAVHYNTARASIGGELNTVFIPREKNGSFKAMGSVNGQSVEFIIDTGASLTTLGGDIAQRVGFIKSCEPVGVVETANGKTFYCLITVSKLNIVGFNFLNVTIAVNPSMQGVALLGSDLLKQFTINQQGNLLMLSR